MPRKAKTSLKDRVAHAYYNYGRFCSSHPVACLVTSIFTILFLASPITRVRLASSSPFDIYLSDNVSDALSASDRPDWLRHPARIFIQQIMVRAKVHPWDAREHDVFEAVKGALSRAFTVHEKLRDFTPKGDTDNHLDNACLHAHVNGGGGSSSYLLPSHGCLLLSPSLFWANDLEQYFKDDEILKTIFEPSCTSTMCPRDLLFGLPTFHTGIKRKYNTNRQRTVNFAITVILHRFDSEYWDAVRDYLASLPGFEVSDVEQDLKFIHVFYRSRKDLSEYIPLAVSYCILLLYLYFAVSKIEMVKSKWGLALSAVFTVAASLIVAAGICHHFDLIPILWGAELFPYLAMIVGLENTLCITRSVVFTPVHLDVRSRVAHGLSKEGYSITKNFLTEIFIVAIGFFTFVPVIQEFCVFSLVGLVVDFYMQLFFYAPCLTFDMLRIAADPEQKQQVNLRHLTANPVELDIYPSVQCPIAMLFPRWFPKEVDAGSRLYRVRSESGGLDRKTSSPTKGGSGVTPGHRRTASHTSDIFVDVEPRHVLRVLPSHIPKRIRVLYFWTNTRFFQRFIMAVTVLWIVWLAFIVHELKLMEQVTIEDVYRHKTQDGASGESYPGNPPTSSSKTSMGSLQWGSWQKKTFKWWPALFDHYNVSLSGQFLTLLPPIIFNSIVSPNDPSVTFTGGHEKIKIRPPPNPHSPQTESVISFMPVELKIRISWLELQMTIVLIVSVGIFAVVGTFILYVCFAGRGSSRSEENFSTPVKKPTHKRVGSKGIVESVPLVFTGHDQEVECLCSAGQDHLISSCLGGQIFVWDTKTGDCVRSFSHPTNPSDSPSRSRVNRQPGTESRRRVDMDASESSMNPGSSQTRADTVGEVPRDQARRRMTSGTAVTSTSVSSGASSGYDFSRFIRGRQETVNSNDSSPSIMFLDFHHDNQNRTVSPVWSMGVLKNLVAVGCASGVVEFWDANSGTSMGKYEKTVGGVTHIAVNFSYNNKYRLILTRLNGILEFVELRFAHRETENTGQYQPPKLQGYMIKSVRAHQRQINCLKVSGSTVITGSADHTLKLFNLRSYSCTRTLYGHNAPVLFVHTDEVMQVMYSSCNDGLVICWDLTEGTLLRTFGEAAFYATSPLALATTCDILVGYGPDGHLWMWHRRTGELLTRIKKESTTRDDGEENGAMNFEGEKEREKRRNSASILESLPCILTLGNSLAVTSHGGGVQLWDLQHKAQLRDVTLNGCGAEVRQLIPLSNDSLSVVCSKGNLIYRVNFPIIKFR